MKAAQSIYYLIGATILIIVVNTVFFLLQSSRNEKNYQAERKTYEVIETANYLLADLKEAESGQRGFMLTNDTSYLNTYRTEERRLNEIYLSLYSSLSEKQEQQENLIRLNNLLKIKKNDISATINLTRRGEAAKALEIIRNNTGKKAMDEISVIIHRIILTEKKQPEQKFRVDN